MSIWFGDAFLYSNEIQWNLKPDCKCLHQCGTSWDCESILSLYIIQFSCYQVIWTRKKSTVFFFCCFFFGGGMMENIGAEIENKVHVFILTWKDCVNISFDVWLTLKIKFNCPNDEVIWPAVMQIMNSKSSILFHTNKFCVTGSY